MQRFIVIGGGVAGLAAAWRLKSSLEAAGRPYSLLVLEASSSVGGAVRSYRREGFLLETGADCFISHKPRALELARELGLASEIIGTRPDFRRSFILRDGRLHAVPEGFFLMGPSKLRPFLQSGLLSWRGKWRVLLEPLVRARRGGGDESLASFVRRRLGRELLDWMAQPLIAGIYGADPEQLSLASTFPQFLEMEEKYGSVLLGLKRSAIRDPNSALSTQDSALRTQHSALHEASGARYALFVSFKNGMQTLVDRLVERIGTTTLRVSTRAAGLERDGDSWVVRTASGERLTADGVVLALPAFAAASLLKGLDSELGARLSAIGYAAAATINLAFAGKDLSRPIDGAGFVVPFKENKAILGVTFAHQKFEGRAPKGFALLRAFIGGVRGPRWLALNDEALTRQVVSELRESVGVRGTPLFSAVSRHAQALPQYSPGHLLRVIDIEERVLRHPRIALAGNWGRGVGLPDTIASGERAADRLLHGF